MSAGFAQWVGLACGCGPKPNKGKGSMSAVQPILKDVVLVGGGHTHVHVLKMFAMKPMAGVRLILISRDVEAPYSGMIPGYVAGFHTREQCHIDIPRLARLCGAIFVHAMVTGIDPDKQLVFVDDGRPPIEYDVVSIDIGITPKANPKIASSRITPAKPIDRFSARWEIMRERAMKHEPTEKPLVIAVVGGGAGGVELCLSMQARMRRDLAARSPPQDIHTHAKFMLFSRGQTLLPSHNRRVGKLFERVFRDNQVEAVLNCDVVEATADHVLVTADGRSFPFDECVWCTQAGAQDWLRSTKLQLTDDGFIAINEFLQSANYGNVFAAGDVASSLTHPRPKAGVFAVRQGPPLLENIRRTLLGKPLQKFVPQTDFLCLIGTGNPETCVLSRGVFSAQGAWVWKMKDWIDKTWMAQVTTKLPFDEMLQKNQPSIPEVALGDEEALCVMRESVMRCGGCGGKVGETPLTTVMRNLKPSLVKKQDVLVGLETADDCAVISHGDSLSCHTVDFFRAFIPDPFIFGKIAAVHAMSDCHAMGIKPHSAMAIAVVPYAKESKVTSTLHQLMAGACAALAESDCALVGGHTAEGSEMAMGFAVTGLTKSDASASAPVKALTKRGLAVGSLLVLTKPIGTGTLMAAEMRGKAKGLWVDAAIKSMCQSNHKAVDVLLEHGAVACTDVTGFGVAGHLVEMCRASRVHVTLDLEALPLLDGAVDCVQRGVFSTLQPQNLRIRRAIDNLENASTHASFPLLFDPQTSGGLLVGIPEANAQACVQALKLAGYASTAVIGKVTHEMDDAGVASGLFISCTGLAN